MNSYITKPMKLWMDIGEYSKLDTSNFTALEKKLAGGILLTKIQSAFKYNEQ